MKVFDQESDVYIGKVSDEEPEVDMEDETPDPDDEELDETPADVIAILGFDPKNI